MSKKTAAEAPPEAKRPPEASFDSFEGDEVNLPDIDGWYTPAEGEAGWVGRILGTFTITDDEGKQRQVAVVRLFSACSSATIEGEPVELSPGNVLAVSMRAKLLGLLDYVESQATVAVKAVGKRKLDAKKSMWLFEIKGQRGKRTRAPTPPRPAPSRAQDDSGEPW